MQEQLVKIYFHKKNNHYSIVFISPAKLQNYMYDATHFEIVDE